MRRVNGYLLAAAVATGALVLVGTAVLGSDDGGGGGGGDPTPASAAPFRSTPLSAYDATGVALTRAAFCTRIDPRLVDATLGGPVTSQRAWGDGDRTLLAADVTDVAHEFGCEYVGAAGVTARAWVFAPPVERAQAARWAKATDSDLGADPAPVCATTTAAFGAPSSLLTCQSTLGRSATYRGLFGDAWLSCEVTAPPATSPAALTDLAGRWCVGAARAATAK